MTGDTRILLVEDDHEDFLLTRDMLRDIDGHTYALEWVDAYDQGMDALDRCEHEICLLDFQLGDRTGLEFLRDAQGRGHTVPIIVLTGQANSELEKDVLAAGAADYLVKDHTKRDQLWRALRHASERNRALEALRQRDRMFRAVFDSTLDAMLIADDAGRYVDANPAACRLFGYSRSRLLSLRIRDVIATQREMPVDFSAFVSAGQQSGEIMIRRGDGELRVMEYTATANIQEDRHLSVLRDVTERRKAEDARQRLASIVESTNEAIIGTTPGWQISSWNRGAEELYGYPRDEVIGKDALDLMTPAAQRFEELSLRRRLLAGETIRNHRTRRWRRDRTTFDASITMSLVRDDGGAITGTAAIVRDVTEENRMRARLALADTMSSLGTLAAGVAHEINNPLTAVISNLALVEGWVTSSGIPGAPSEIHDMLADATEAADRVRLIVRDLRIFSRPQEDQIHAVDVRGALETILRMAHNEIRHRARVVRDFAETPMVDANEGRLGQVFMNLLVNAAQAIPEGNVANHEIRVSTRSDATHVKIQVSDTGAGIPADKLEKIFEPFFTTKPVGVGTGLGLSICHGIVSAMGGQISVTSVVGQGTTFEVLLPIGVRGGVAGARVATPQRSAQARARVLFIDDEPTLLKAASRLLANHHEVLTAASAQDALVRIGSGEHFDVIFCDLMMPQMTGIDLHAELTQVAPHVIDRMVFATGGAFSADALAFLSAVPNRQIEKPFTRAVLLDVIRELTSDAAS